MNLRVTAEADLYRTLEHANDWGLPVELIAPDGTIQTKSANHPTEDLKGQVLYDTTVVNPETGLDMVIDKPVVTLRRSSLDRIPAADENWMIRIPETPDPTATKTLHKIERAPEQGKAIGFIRLYLTKAIEADP